ncbi:MAG TPA: DNA repair protein RecO [Myxococcota bacterium]|nr:DNA repair protein RecO [Myxococcota bacterium]
MPREHRTRALVLRSFDQNESDRLLHLYTEDLGRVSAIAKGARRSRRRFPGALELFSLIEVRLVAPPRSLLMRLEAARVAQAFEGLTGDLGRFAIACQFVELLDRLTAEGDAHPELFGFAVGVLDVLRSERPDRLLALLVLLKTLARLGYRPQLGACAVCGAGLGASTSAFSARHGGALCPVCAPAGGTAVPTALLGALERGLRSPLRERAALALEPDAVLRAQRLLGDFFRFHVGFEPRSAGFLELALARVDGPPAPRNTPRARATGVPLR